MSNNKLHVLQVTGIMNRGGAEVMLMDIFRNISSDMHFDFLVNRREKDSGVRGEFDEEILQRGAKMYHIGTQWELGIAKYVASFREIVIKIGTPDVVHIHLNAKCGVIAFAAHKSGIRKIIAHSHADLKFRGSILSVLAGKLELVFQKFMISRYATDYWGCSKEALNSLFYNKLHKTSRVAIINNAVDLDVFQNVSEDKLLKLKSELRITDDTIVIGNVGRVVRHKKVDFIIDLLSSLKDTQNEIKFVFAGRSDDKEYMEEILSKIKKYQLEDMVLPLGDRGDIPALMSIFDVFVGPALKEGFGLVAAEAQAAGVPCVLYSGFPKSVDMGLNLVKFIDNFETGSWVKEILDSINKKCKDKDLIRQRFTERAYDVAENTSKIEALYRQQL